MVKINFADANRDVKFIDGCLHIGTCKVDSSTCKPSDERIAAWYMVRVLNEMNYYEIVTGLDLTSKGMIWLGGYHIPFWKNQMQVSIPSSHYDDFETVERILNTLCADTIGKQWIICEEPDFDEDFKDW